MIVTLDKDLELIRKAGKLAGEILEMLTKNAKAGITTLELDQMAEKAIRNEGAIPTFKGYRNFPGTLCISINEEVVHGIPSKSRIIKDGDLLSMDLGVTFQREENGKKLDLIADTAVTVAVGAVSKRQEQLIIDTRESLYAGIKASRAGASLDDIGGAVEDVGNAGAYGIVREYGGHGIGYVLHEEPFIFNYRTGSKTRLKPGMVIAIEPMFNLGGDRVRTKQDGWTVVTQDYKASAHFEHSILITEDEPEVLTRRPNEEAGWQSKA